MIIEYTLQYLNRQMVMQWPLKEEIQRVANFIWGK